MKTIEDTAFKINEWQKEFIDRYAITGNGMSLLVAPQGSGKTAVALHLAMRLLNDGAIDGVINITHSKVLEEYFRGRAMRADIPMKHLRFSGATASTKRAELLSKIDPTKRWLIFTNDIPIADQVTKPLREFLSASRESRALLISGSPPKKSTESSFDNVSEYYLDQRVTLLQATQNRLIGNSPSFRLLHDFQRETADIDNMSWRDFEKLIARLLERDNYTVELMKGTKDGGVDVIGYKDLGPAGTLKTLWQAKKNSLKNRVGISVVRELADTRQELGASKAIIVTSSFLTRGALQRIERDKCILGKVDRHDLEHWIDDVLFGRQEVNDMKATLARAKTRVRQ